MLMMCFVDAPPAGGGPVIAVIGAGASGTLTAVYLLREAAARRVPLQVALIDRHGRHGLGQAYSTTHPAHLLNSPVGKMSAVAGDPDHLTRWAEAVGLGCDGFLPRSAYGRYLRELLADAERAARPAARVSRITAEVVAIRRLGRALRLQLAAGGSVDADIAVLATGNPPPAPPCPVPRCHRYINDPWEPGAIESASDGSPVVVLGTGLTMLDVAIALTGADPGTVVHAISRHGLLPCVHSWPRPAATVGTRPVIRETGTPLRLAGLIRDVRASAARRGGDWQDVVDAVRPQIPRLWAQLPEADKRLFLRDVARYWEVHRHRMPPATARRIGVLREAGRLSVLRGRVVDVSPEPGGVRVRIDRGDPHPHTAELTAGWLINCTGPGRDITATGGRLMHDLLEVGLARPDSLRLGLDTDSHGAVRDASGRPAEDIVTLGPPLRGLWYETTAIPEIRDQAAALARFLSTRLAHARPGSAA